MRLLLIEDNLRLADYLSTALRNGGFAVDHVSTTADAEEALATTRYDTLLLDLGLPDKDGLIWLGDQRRSQMTRPVLVLTARDSVEDLVAGLNQGADDYLRKPFDLDELIARVRALLRRPGEALGVNLTAGNVTLDTSAREVIIDGLPVEFGRRERPPWRKALGPLTCRSLPLFPRSWEWWVRRNPSTPVALLLLLGFASVASQISFNCNERKRKEVP